MLEVKNLVKCYSTKGGVTVKALDNVSVKFPETGMVFLLGRSGSGKSTLLNVSGGLDKPDSGEIIVKGRSSKDFSASDFDSYRNTYVGFVFQEYNILNEFTVEQNISLALQLQSKPNDKKAVNELLEKVDLKGLGKRKPNTLSGGQKQRVAIARALIKEPEIIMADEPTGALDSNTGKQVLDTLKKLSETKLVVVVSHDREFAEQYGDRIIELKDGQILSDVSKAYSTPTSLNENVQVISDDTISIRNAEDITESDVKNIVAMLKKNKGEAIITASKREIPDVKRACKINEDGHKEYFKDTTDVKTKEYDGKKTKFIKSKLPASHAFKMGASGLKTKPIRLIFTIFLSVVAFLMFGVVSTFMLYDPNYSISEAMAIADYPSMTLSKYYVAIEKSIKVDNATGKETLNYQNERDFSTLFGAQELADKNALSQGDFAGIFNFTDEKYSGNNSRYSIMLVNGTNSVVPNVSSTKSSYYPVTQIFGFTDCGAEYMTRNGFTLVGAGRYPETKTEVALPEYLVKLFVETEGSGIEEVDDIIGKKIKFSGCNAINSSDSFTVVGVYNVGSIPSKYDDLKDSTNNNISSQEKEKLQTSLTDYLTCNFNSIVYVTPDFYDEYKGNMRSSSGVYVNSVYANGIRISDWEIQEDYMEWGSQLFTEKTVADYQSNFKFYNLNGEEITFALNKNQAFINISKYENAIKNTYNSYMYEFVNNFAKYDADALALIADDTPFDVVYDDFWGADDISPVVNVLNSYYDILARRQYVLNSAEKMINYATGFTPSAEFTNAFNKAQNFVNGVENAEEPTDAEWTILENVVFDQTSGFKVLCPQSYYYIFAEEIANRLNWSENLDKKEIIDSDLGEPFHENYWRLQNGDAPIDYFEKIKPIIESYYPVLTGKQMVPYEVMDTSLDFSLYYQNYLNNKGEFEVVGFYALDGDGYADALVHSEFVEENMQKREGMGDDFTWRNVEETDYVRPLDAKYNNLVTLTNNTQEEITNALTGGNSVKIKINNSVYAQLEMFLGMITSMQEVFLIVGAVLGVFAALMLLNFISVSITAKRKDIGILRAVGARGSDVFKIFFAEAFIIALICFVLATAGAYVVCNVLNTSMVTIVNMKLLNFQIVNVGLILAVSFGISILATFFPVYFASKKSPVESIRAL